MAPQRREWTYTYEDLAKICGMTPAAMRTAASPGRNQLDPEDLESVILYMAVNGSDAFRTKLMLSMIRSESTAYAAPKPSRVKKPVKRKARQPRTE